MNMLAALLLALVGAQDPSSPTAAAEVPPPEAMQLSLDDYVRLVLQNNIALGIAKIDQRITETFIEQQLGVFDPELFGSVQGGKNEPATTSTFVSTSQTFAVDAGVRGLTRTGGTYNLLYTVDHSLTNLPAFFTSANKSLGSSLTLSMRQPLLRGGGSLVNESGVQSARLQVQEGDHSLMTRIHDTAYAAVQAYWNLVFRRESLATANEAYEVAQELTRNNQQKMDAGVMTVIDVLTAKAEEARRDEERIVAKNAEARAQDTLKFLLSPGESLAAWEAEVVLTTELGDRDDPLPSQEEAILTAFQERDDLKALQTSLRISDLNLAVADHEILPELALLGSYTLSGIDASDDNIHMWRDSLSDIYGRDFNSWSLGAEVAYPIGNRSADANQRAARMEKERAMMALAQLRMNIVQDTRAALRDLLDARARADAAQVSQELASKQYDAEKIRLDNEYTTTFEVREAQRDLFEAKDTYISARVTYEVQRARLAQVQGLLAFDFGVEWVGETLEPGVLYE